MNENKAIGTLQKGKIIKYTVKTNPQNQYPLFNKSPILQKTSGNRMEQGYPVVEDPYLTNLDMFSAASVLPGSTTPQEYWPFPQRPKPPSSVKELAVIALEYKSDKIGSTQDVCNFISRHFPYYRQNNRWHHTVKCNMADKRYFIKQPKRYNYGEYIANPVFKATINVESLKAKLKHHVDVDL